MFLFLLLRYIDFYVAKWYNEPESGDIMIYTVDEIKQRVEPVAKKYDIEKVYLFGSYARGDATEESDIDLRIDGDQKIRSLIDLSGLFLDFENERSALQCLTSILSGPFPVCSSACLSP